MPDLRERSGQSRLAENYHILQDGLESVSLLLSIIGWHQPPRNAAFACIWWQTQSATVKRGVSQ